MRQVPEPATKAGAVLSRREFVATASLLALAVQRGDSAVAADNRAPQTSPTSKLKRSSAGTKTMRALFAAGGGPPRFESIAAPRLESDLSCSPFADRWADNEIVCVKPVDELADFASQLQHCRRAQLPSRRGMTRGRHKRLMNVVADCNHASLAPDRWLAA
jgi:hypothetical protein